MRVSDPLTPSMQAALQGGLLHELNRAVGLTIAKRVRLPRGREADEGPKDGQGALHHSRAAVTRTKLLNGHGGTARHPRRMLHEVDVEGGAEEDTGQSSSDREQDHSTPRRSLPILGPTLPFRHFDANDKKPQRALIISSGAHEELWSVRPAAHSLASRRSGSLRPALHLQGVRIPAAV